MQLGASHLLSNLGWIVAGIVPLFLALAPFTYKGLKNWRYERRLMRGIPESPGIAGVSPLGDRLMRQERGLMEVKNTVEGHTTILQHHTGQLTEQSGQLDRIMAEVTPNGGGSIKDQIGRADHNAALAVEKVDDLLTILRHMKLVPELPDEVK